MRDKQKKVEPFNEIRTKMSFPDDIAIYDLHLERMSPTFWWLGIYKNGKRTTFHIESESPIIVELIENELKTKIK